MKGRCFTKLCDVSIQHFPPAGINEPTLECIQFVWLLICLVGCPLLFVSLFEQLPNWLCWLRQCICLRKHPAHLFHWFSFLSNFIFFFFSSFQFRVFFVAVAFFFFFCVSKRKNNQKQRFFFKEEETRKQKKEKKNKINDFFIYITNKIIASNSFKCNTEYNDANIFYFYL